jgi:murein DD-endopeptidase MepM/ murein hydrolase activator NlpD
VETVADAAAAPIAIRRRRQALLAGFLLAIAAFLIAVPLRGLLLDAPAATPQLDVPGRAPGFLLVRGGPPVSEQRAQEAGQAPSDPLDQVVDETRAMLATLIAARAADMELRNELHALKRDNERLAAELAQANTRRTELARSSELAEAHIAELTKAVDAARRDTARGDEELTRLRRQNDQLNRSLARADATRNAVLAEAEKAQVGLARKLEAATYAAAQSRADLAGLLNDLEAKDQELAATKSAREEVGARDRTARDLAPRAHVVSAPAPQAKPALVEPVAGLGVGLEVGPVPWPDGDRYTVRSGETLSAIALRQGSGKPDRIYAGQKLRSLGGAAALTAAGAFGDDRSSVRPATGQLPLPGDDDFLWPVNGKVIGAFGPIDQRQHRDGIDIAAPRGALVLAAQDAVVAYAGDGIEGYGQMILLRHDQGYMTIYAHNDALLVEVDDAVKRGQVIARVGDTGHATQSMLHFELRKGRIPIDPQARLVHGLTKLASSTEAGGIEQAGH